MDIVLIKKMIRNSLYKYQHDDASIPLTTADYEELYKRILHMYEEGKEDLYEIVEDVVYEYLTNG